MFSSGHRTLFSEVATWVFLAAVSVVGVTHFEALKAIAHRLAGTDMARLDSARTPAPVAHSGSVNHDGYTVELPVSSDGHYHAEAEINGRSVTVLVDTGASVVALTAEDAEAAGIYVSDKDFTARIQTANGAARVAPVALDKVTIGDITLRDVRAVVCEAGAMTISLLGMTFLGELDRVDMRSGKLILQD
jgi:aspartyl protease family protein